MEVNALQFRISEESGVGQARRDTAALARRLGFDDADVGRVALVITECATNCVKHAREGELLIHALATPGTTGIGVIALDRGPGIANLAQALRDGFSTTGTPGNGLGAIARMASIFDLYSHPDSGTAVLAEIWPTAKQPIAGLVIGGVNVPCPGETVSGDDWAVEQSDGHALLLMVDGLGHGAHAHSAARAAVSAFRNHPTGTPAEMLERIHDALRPTRGAAAAVIEVDRPNKRLRFAGIGNIAGTILTDDASRGVVSHHGTVGHHVRRIQEFTYPWRKGALLVLHSDGLVSHWTFDRYPGLRNKHPMLAAAVLYRDFARQRDDTTVVVVRDDGS
jgi:anti-sigma regulatory factor (Ser/Thr protein kinase)